MCAPPFLLIQPSLMEIVVTTYGCDGNCDDAWEAEKTFILATLVFQQQNGVLALNTSCHLERIVLFTNSQVGNHMSSYLKVGAKCLFIELPLLAAAQPFKLKIFCNYSLVYPLGGFLKILKVQWYEFCNGIKKVINVCCMIFYHWIKFIRY